MAFWRRATEKTPVPAPRENVRLALYDSMWCGYSQDVRAVIEELGLPVELRRINGDPKVRQELFAATGRHTVPVLRIERDDGSVRWMPESRDIIRYLRALADKR